MNTTAIYIKTQPEVKVRAQQVAKELGFSLSSLLNAWLRQLIKTKTITFSTLDEEPSEYLIKMMKQAKKDLKAGKASPTFNNAKDAIAFLEKLRI